MLYHIAWLILQPWKFFLNFDGFENIHQKEGPMVVVSSHRAWNDPWRIGIFFSFWQAIHSFAKKEFYCPFMAFAEFNTAQLPIISRVIIKSLIPVVVPVVVWGSKTIMVDKKNERNPVNLKALKKAYKLLGKEKIVGIFPRGTIFPTDYVNQSFVRLAVRTVKNNNGKKVGVTIAPVNLFDEKVTFGPQFCLVPSLCKKTEYQEIAKKIIEWVESDFSYPLNFQEKTISAEQSAEEDR